MKIINLTLIAGLLLLPMFTYSQINSSSYSCGSECERLRREAEEKWWREHIKEKPNYLTEQQWQFLLDLGNKNPKSLVRSYVYILGFDLNDPVEIRRLPERIERLNKIYKEYLEKLLTESAIYGVEQKYEISPKEKKAYEMIYKIWADKYNSIYNNKNNFLQQQFLLNCPNLTEEQTKKIISSIDKDSKENNILFVRCYPDAEFKLEKRIVGVIREYGGDDGEKLLDSSYGTKGFEALKSIKFKDKVFAVSLSTEPLSGEEDACPEPYTCYSFANIYVYDTFTGKREMIISAPYTKEGYLFSTLYRSDAKTYPIETIIFPRKMPDKAVYVSVEKFVIKQDLTEYPDKYNIIEQYKVK